MNPDTGSPGDFILVFSDLETTGPYFASHLSGRGSSGSGSYREAFKAVGKRRVLIHKCLHQKISGLTYTPTLYVGVSD